MSKKKYAKLDEESRIHFAAYETDEEAAEKGFLPFVETEMPATEEGVIPYNYSRGYNVVDGKVVVEWKAYPNYEAIAALKDKLTSSDYKIIKCYEATLAKEELPYDIGELRSERQEIRNEINRLEACE